MDDESESVRLNGVTVEGQFTFSKALGNFLREEVRVGGFRGTMC